MIFYIDIDETICFYEGERHYPNALPYTERIKKINDLYDAGHTIVYWTARGSQTGIDWTETTRQQLVKWGAKFHDVKLGKPHFDMYICDKAMNCETFFNKGEEIR